MTVDERWARRVFGANYEDALEERGWSTSSMEARYSDWRDPHSSSSREIVDNTMNKWGYRD